MIVPSIDLMDGRAVQLRRGEERILVAVEDPVDLAKRFNRFGEVAVIDLDAALGRGDNLDLVRRMCRVADVRAGGGVRTVERGRALLRAGASCIIVGTAASPDFLGAFPRERVMAALDHRDGRVVDRGWTRDTGETVAARARRLAPYCAGFLCTFVEDEGGMSGLDVTALDRLRGEIPGPLTVAGGVRNHREITRLSRMGLDVQVGMSLYTGRTDPVEAVVESLDFEKCPLLPTVVQDEDGRVLMLAYSSPASLRRALNEGKGIYHSRSRNRIWVKGTESGCTQELVACRADCDRDTLLFRVRQKGPACHRGTASCFGPGRFTLERLFHVLRKRRRDLPEGSYSAGLFRDRERLARKLMEEAFEATRAREREDLVWELADLVFFASVMAVDRGIGWEEIESELSGRVKGERS